MDGYRETAHRRAIRLPHDAYRNGEPFLVTLRAAGAIPRFRDEPLAAIVVHRLDGDLCLTGGSVGAYCLMPDHLHAIVMAPDLVRWVSAFKSATSSWARRAGLTDRLWQRRFHDRRLERAGEALDAATRYLVENPVRGGLVESWERWPYVRIGWRA
jgi:hypothetical protein